MSAPGSYFLARTVRDTGRWTWRGVVDAVIEVTLGAAIGALVVLAVIEWVAS